VKNEFEVTLQIVKCGHTCLKVPSFEVKSWIYKPLTFSDQQASIQVCAA